MKNIKIKNKLFKIIDVHQTEVFVRINIRSKNYVQICIEKFYKKTRELIKNIKSEIEILTITKRNLMQKSETEIKKHMFQKSNTEI